MANKRRKKRNVCKAGKKKEAPRILTDDLAPATKTERGLNQEDPIEREIIKVLRNFRHNIAAELARKADKLESPLSETLQTSPNPIPDKIQDKMDAFHCTALLRAMAESDPKRHISRNYFRNNSGIKESTWSQFFGTFNQFKRSAGITLSRGAHRHGLNISKHAGSDQYEEIAKQREGYATKYDRDNPERWQTMVIGSDFHDVEVDPFAFRVFLDTVFRIQPDIICLSGDFFDLYEFSKYTQDPRDFNPVERLWFGHDMLYHLREAAPNAQIDLIEGNHEMRLLRHLADATPAMLAVLADLHGYTVPTLLGLDEFEINYHGRASLKARSFTERDHKRELERNWKVYFGCVMAHHFPTGQKMGMPGFHGHYHLHQVWPHRSVKYGGPYEWHQLGSMCKRISHYTDGEQWSNGFMIAHVDTHKELPNFEYVPITNFAVVGGEYYYRTEEEKIWEDSDPQRVV